MLLLLVMLLLVILQNTLLPLTPSALLVGDYLKEEPVLILLPPVNLVNFGEHLVLLLAELQLVMHQVALTKSGLILCSLCAEATSTVARSAIRRPTATIGLALSTVVTPLTSPASAALASTPPTATPATTDPPCVVSQSSVRD